MSPILLHKVYLFKLFPHRRWFLSTSIYTLVKEIRIVRIVHAFLIVKIIKVNESFGDRLMLRIIPCLEDLWWQLLLAFLKSVDFILCKMIICFPICYGIFPICYGTILCFFHSEATKVISFTALIIIIIAYISLFKHLFLI